MLTSLGSFQPAMEFTGATTSDLSERELEMLQLITNGYSNAQITQVLHLSLNTVKTHIRACYRKIGADTRAHAVVWGVRHGLLAGVSGSDLA